MQLQAFSGGELVEAEGTPISLQRQAWRLALFAGTRSGRRATTDEIVDALWGDTPPATARETVHVLVNRIRRGAGASTLELTPGGYRLNVDLDLDDVLTAFDERRRREEEHWAALRIRLDTAPDVIEEFRAATDDQPLREVRWEHLMLALYQAGRRADALRAYDDARTHLQSSLGVDPGPALRRLHRAILDHDVPPEGSFPAPPATSHRWEPLVGRTTELQRMEQLVTRGRLVTVTGIGGVGKSRLVDEYAYRRLLAGAHTHILGVLPGHTTEELARLLIATAERSLLQGDADLLDIAVVLASTSDLLVIDGAERAPDAAVGLIDHLIGHCPNLRVVATSRQPLRTATEVLLPLDGLDLASGRGSAAHQLFAERLGVDLTAASAEDLVRFDTEVVRTGGIPIQIELAVRLDPDRVEAIFSALTPCLGERFHGFRPTLGGPLHPDLLPGLDDEYDGLHAVIDHHLRVGNGTAAIELNRDAAPPSSDPIACSPDSTSSRRRFDHGSSSTPPTSAPCSTSANDSNAPVRSGCQPWSAATSPSRCSRTHLNAPRRFSFPPCPDSSPTTWPRPHWDWRGSPTSCLTARLVSR